VTLEHEVAQVVRVVAMLAAACVCAVVLVRYGLIGREGQ